MIKNMIKFCGLFFFTMSLSLHAQDNENIKETISNRSLSLGVGSSIGSNFMFFHGQGELEFTIFRKDRFSLHLGPLIDLSVGKLGLLADFDASLKARYRFPLRKSYAIDVYAKLPIGYTLVAEIGEGPKHLNHGLNLGLIPGFEFQFNERVGLFVEIGYQSRIIEIFNKPKGYSYASGSLGIKLSL